MAKEENSHLFSTPEQLVGRLAGGAAVGIVIKFTGLGLAFLFFLVLARVTTKIEFGIFASAFSLATIVGFAATLGQHSAILRFWPVFDEKYGPGVASRVTLYGLGRTLSGGLAAMIGFGILSLLTLKVTGFGGGRWIYLWTGTMALAMGLSEFTSAAMRAKGSIVVAMAPREIGWRGLVIFTTLFAPSALSGEAALAITALLLLTVTLPQLGCLVMIVWKNRHFRLTSNQRSALNHASWGLWGGAAVGPVSEQVTTIIVGMTLGPAAAAGFFAADRLAKLLSVALVGTNQIAGPMLARSYHAGREEEVKFVAAASTAFALAIAVIGFVGYLLLGRFALGLFDSSYRDAYPVLLLLSLGQVVNNACGPNGLLLNMAGRERDYLAIVAIWGAAGVLGAYLGAMSYGLSGCAIANVGVVVGWNLTATIVCRVRLGIWIFSPRVLMERVRNYQIARS